MTQVDDLSRSLIAFEQNNTVVVVLEMSQSSWLAAGVVPGIERRPLKKLYPDPTVLLRLVEGWRDHAMKAGRMITRIVLAFEAGRDGFWLARWLRARSIETFVIHSTSVAVSRERRTRVARWSTLKAWGIRIAKRSGLRKAKVAVARKLAVILHRMWIEGTEFKWLSKEAANQPA